MFQPDSSEGDEPGDSIIVIDNDPLNVSEALIMSTTSRRRPRKCGQATWYSGNGMNTNNTMRTYPAFATPSMILSLLPPVHE